jgi:glyoxylate reductase
VFISEALEMAHTEKAVEGILSIAHPSVTGDLLDKLGKKIKVICSHSTSFMKVISNYGVGCDHIDLAAAHARGIPVGNTPDVLTDSTADMGFALLLACARLIPQVRFLDLLH